jgi:transposase InsO family protein
VRRVLVERQSPMSVATDMGVSLRTVAKWVRRFELEGEPGLADRSSRPHRLRAVTPEAVIEQVVALRCERWTGKQIAKACSVSSATVSRILRRHRLSRMRDIDPPVPVVRYERAEPGEMIHLDIKKLGRFEQIGHRITGDPTSRIKRLKVGWEYVHVAIDDASRIACASILPDEKAGSAAAALHHAVAYYQSLGITVARVMTDNGGCYRSEAFRLACRDLALRHIRTKPYTPRTNGKAERFIQTALREWAYARAYPNSDARGAELQPWLHRYNWHRPHGGIKHLTPITRLRLTENNLLRLHS